MTVLCQEFRTLPRAGGLLDQDSYDVWIMQGVINAQREKEKREQSKNKIQGNKK